MKKINLTIDYLSASLIVCGVDNVEGPQVYSVCMGGTAVRQNIVMSGSGSQYIYGFVDTNFRVGMSKQDAKEFIKQAVTLATYRDNSSGGIVRLMDITNEGYERDVISFDDLNFPDN